MIVLLFVKLSPDYVGVELGIGESLLIKAISESTGRSLAIVKADLKKEGDLGLVASARMQYFHLAALMTRIHSIELQSQPEDAIQTQVLDGSFCIHQSERNCPLLRSFSEPQRGSVSDPLADRD